MPERLFHRLVKRLRAADPAAGDLPTDGELLDRYLRARDEAAFELLVLRHGALVLGVCRRTLHDTHAAEDAFQATFLVLARKARSVRQTTVAGWLYRVALRIALRARQGAARRAFREQPLVSEPATNEPDPLAGSDVRAVLDDEVGRLPERFRLPVLLCYVEGHTTEQAAQLLGCPRGTILSRLATARKRLSGRLLRRGIGMPAAGLAVVLAEPAWPAAVPGGFSLSEAPPQAIHLAEGVIHAMFLNKLKVAFGTVLVLGVLAVAAGRMVLDTPAQGQDRPRVVAAQKPQPPQASPRKEAKAQPDDPQEKAQAQLERARKELAIRADLLADLERRHSRESLDLRLKLLALEEELRSLDRTRDAELADSRRRLELAEKSPESVFGDLPKEVLALANKIDKLRESAKADATEIDRLRKASATRRNKLAADMEILRRGGLEIEQRYAERSLPLREKILSLEEQLRLAERRANRESGFAEAEVAASANRVRQLEGLPAATGIVGRPNAEMERRLEELLREVAALRKELQRQRAGK